MHARTFNQGRLVAAGLAIAVALLAVLAISALSDSGAGSTEAPRVTPAVRPVAPAPSKGPVQKPLPGEPAQAAPMPANRTSSKRSVIVQSGRSAQGRSVTVQGAPGESATATAQPGGGAAKGGAGGSASAKGRSATSGSVQLQSVGP